ncbi:hypothetical protein IMZ48_40125 [Candidatus Bathyarchaeota archaeon]|nr:hypothetical protein [Candidatus Bathyarchaeota archaeon]
MSNVEQPDAGTFSLYKAEFALGSDECRAEAARSGDGNRRRHSRGTNVERVKQYGGGFDDGTWIEKKKGVDVCTSL